MFMIVELVIEKSALKGFARMQAKAAEAMMTRPHTIAADPYARHANVERMKGRKNGFRLRQGDWRAIYELDPAASQMRVRIVETRGSVYR